VAISIPTGYAMLRGVHSQKTAVTYAELINDLMGDDVGEPETWQYTTFPPNAQRVIGLMQWAIENEYELEITDLGVQS
jgi:hypothetical protein